MVLILNATEGAIRKWVLLGSSQLFYFAKDVVLIIAVLLFFLGGHHKPNKTTRNLGVFYGIIAFVLVLDAFNPNLGSPIIGLFGAKCYLLYGALIYLGAQLFQDWTAFQRFVRWHVVATIVICMLGVAQFAAPTDAMVNRYAAGDEQMVITFGTADSPVRITGTFAFITGHVFFLFVSSAVALGLLGTSVRRSNYLLAVGALVMSVGNILMTGSRSAGFLTAALAGLLFFWFGFQSNRVALRLRTIILIAAAFAVFSVSTLFNKAYNAYLDRIESSEEEFMDRAFQHHEQLWGLASYVGFAGFGPGITHPGSAAIQQALKLPPMSPVPEMEAEYARIVVELGPIGALLWYAFRLVLLAAIWKTYRSLGTIELRYWAFIIFLIHLLTFNSQLVLNHTFSIYYWFLAGVAFGLPRFEALRVQPATTMSEPVARHAAATAPA